MKIILIAGAAIIVVMLALLFIMEPAQAPSSDNTELTPTTTTETGRIANPDTAPNPVPSGKLKVGNFTGKLEEVNTGCFSDGECYVVVDGKHITTTMGWNQSEVGSIIGAPSIGDMESMIGSEIEVYAQDTSDGKYTLYGSAGFYIKVIKKGANADSLPIAKAQCIVGGCSSQLCVEDSGEPVVSTCEYKEVYACYKTAKCERQSTGKCGWTDSSTLSACIANDGATAM